MAEERLQKILARAGVTSRRKAEELIRGGRVTVNGQLAGIGDKADPERDTVKLDGKRIQPHQGQHRYLLLNKPRGVMTTVEDPEGRQTVMDFVPPGFKKALVPVGRLDFNTEGLLLLTDDGDFAHRVAHPRHGCVKTYEAKVKGRPEESDVEKLRAGISIEGRRTAPAVIEPRPRHGGDGDNSWWVIELSEGRTRQIREMFLRIGHPVQKLRRVAIGPVADPELPPGALRELTEREVEALRRSSGPDATKRRGVIKAARRAPARKGPGAPAGAAAKRAARPGGPAPGERGDRRERGERGEGARTEARPRAAAPARTKKAAEPASAGWWPSARGAAGTPRRSAGGAREAGGAPRGGDRPRPAGGGAGPRRAPAGPAGDERRGGPARASAARPPRVSGERPPRASGERPPRPSGARPAGGRPSRPSGGGPPRSSGGRPARPSGGRPPRGSAPRGGGRGSGRGRGGR